MNPTALPFSVQANLGRSLAGGLLRVELHARPVPRPDLDPSFEMLDAFARAVACQFFATGDEPAGMALRESERMGSGGGYRIYDVRNVSMSSWHVLLALLAQTAHAGDELLRLVLAGHPAGADDRMAGLPELVDADVLARRARVPFEVVFPDEVPEGGALEIRMEFADDLDAKQASGVGEDLTIWGLLGAMGGFAFDFREQEDFEPDFGEPSHVEPRVIVHSMETFGGPVGALNLLVNYGFGLTRKGLRPTRLVVEA